MTSGLHKTWNVLAQTHNRAALPVLVAALDSPHVVIRASAIGVLLRRRDAAGHEQVLRRYGRFGETERTALENAVHDRPHRLKTSLRAAVLGHDAALCENACHVILLTRDYDQFAHLIQTSERASDHQSAQATATLLRLATLLSQELLAGGHVRGKRRDPSFVRCHVLTALQRSLSRYEKHQRLEIVEAFLQLALPNNKTLIDILVDVRHPCHECVVQTLSSSTVPGIMQLVVHLLHDTEVPAAVIQVVAERSDRRFLEYLLSHLGTPLAPRVLNNLVRLKQVAWLQERRDVLLELDGSSQAAAVQCAVATRIDRTAKFDALALVLKNGAVAGRRASCRLLADFHRPEAGQLVLAALEDPDPGVQAAAALQLRERHLPGALEKLAALLDAPAEELRAAARASLGEFNFDRYFAVFEMLDQLTRKSTGALVYKADPTAGGRVAALLASPAPSVRLQGVQMLLAMDAADDFCPQLLNMLDDRDGAVVAEAAGALGRCRRPEVGAALELATHDPRAIVASAARQSLERLPSSCRVGAARDGKESES